MPRKNTIRKKVVLFFILFLLLIILWGIITLVSHFGETASNILLHPAPSLKENNGRVNILLLGIGGGKHDGPDLTDTIIYASLDKKNQTITFISLPRDLWIDNIHNKMNVAYATGGKEQVKHIVEDIIGQPVDYVLRIDFQGFVKIIDTLGGVDINVLHTLDDYAYPVSGKEDDTCGYALSDIQAFSATDSSETDIQQKFACRFMHLHIEQGLQHMDGTTALEFVRSRHAAGEEGTDFARSHRQQLLVAAVRKKVFSLQTIFNTGKIMDIYSLVQESIDTNIKENEVLLFIQLFQKLQQAKMYTAVLDFGDSSQNRYGVLENGAVDAAHGYADFLMPRAGENNFTEIHQYVACILKHGSCTVPPKPDLSPWITKKQ